MKTEHCQMMRCGQHLVTSVDVPEMSLDEINGEIKMLREERKYIL